jgi:hypothetical protein
LANKQSTIGLWAAASQGIHVIVGKLSTENRYKLPVSVNLPNYAVLNRREAKRFCHFCKAILSLWPDPKAFLTSVRA